MMLSAGGVCVDVVRRCVCLYEATLGVTNAQEHFIDRWDVTVRLAKARLRTRVPCKMSKMLAYFRGLLIAPERSVAVQLAATLRNAFETSFPTDKQRCQRPATPLRPGSALLYSCYASTNFSSLIKRIMRADQGTVAHAGTMQDE